MASPGALPVAAGTLAANTSEKTVRFTAKTGRFVRLVALSEMNGNPWTSAAELNIFGAGSPVLDDNDEWSPRSIRHDVVCDVLSIHVDNDRGQVYHTCLSKDCESVQHQNGRGHRVVAEVLRIHTHHDREPEHPLGTDTDQYAHVCEPLYGCHCDCGIYQSRLAPPAGLWLLGWWRHLQTTPGFPGARHLALQNDGDRPVQCGLHNREGDVQVLPYTGTNPLYRHGFLQVSADHRFLVHADGTPFLWLGDTLWDATVGLTEAGFHEAVADRRAKHFTVLQTNLAHQDEVDTAGDTPWQGDRWNVRFMQKLDRMFTDANDQGLYLLVNGLGDLVWDRGRPHSERLLEMIGARYAAHYVSFASRMEDPSEPLHEQIHAAIQRTAPRHLVTQHPEAATPGPGTVWTAEQSDDSPLVDYVLHATGGDGDLEGACQQAIDGSLRLYRHVPPKPVVNGQAWYKGVASGTAEIAAQLGYLSFLSGNVGYTYGSSLWNATDTDLPAWEAARGATYMQYLYDFFAALDSGRPLLPRHALIKNQAKRYRDRMVLGVSTDGMTYAAFLPNGGTINVDLAALAGTTVGVTWYNPLTGQYHDQGTTPGGVVRSFVSPFGASQSALVLMAH